MGLVALSLEMLNCGLVKASGVWTLAPAVFGIGVG